MKRLLLPVFGLLFAAGIAGAFLISNAPAGGGFAFEAIPSNRRPADILVDTEGVPGVASPLAVVADLAGQWNGVPEAQQVFGTVSFGGPYNGDTVGVTFGTFADTQYEVAFDPTGEVFAEFGISPGVLGITLKSVLAGSGTLLDFLVVINTSNAALSSPGSGASAEELFRATLLHELGHATGLSHTPTGIANSANGFGLVPAAVNQVPTMYAFRLPQQPALGGTITRDDAVGVIENYPGDRSALGSISGRVRGVSGAPVNEIAVRAVGPFGSGEEHIGVLTNVDGTDAGTFRIPNLLPGPYRVVIETVNGRASVDQSALIGGGTGLGSNVFIKAADELWQVGDSFDPAVDDPTETDMVYVRAGRDSGAIDFVLDAMPLTNSTIETLANGDSLYPNSSGGFRFADYYVFQGTAGDAITLTVSAGGFVPQLQLLSDLDFSVLETDAPVASSLAEIQATLPRNGAYTVLLYARATTGNLGGTGNYTITLSGNNGTLPTPLAAKAAAAIRGPGDPGAQEFGSPASGIGVLQLRVTAPNREQLWVDTVTVRGSGTANDPADVDAGHLVDDRNGNGIRDGGEPTLGTGVFTANDGTVQFAGLDITIDPRDSLDLLVVYDVTVTSVSSPATAALSPAWLIALACVPLLWRRRRLALLLLCVALPIACGGGGGGGAVFNPDGAIVTFQATVDAGGVTAFTPTTDPGSPIALPATGVTSGTLSVSN